MHPASILVPSDRRAGRPVVSRPIRAIARVAVLVALSTLLTGPARIARAGDDEWHLPVRWCSLAGSAAADRPGDLGEMSTGMALWHRHERPTDNIYQHNGTGITFRSAFYAGFREVDAFPVIEYRNAAGAVTADVDVNEDCSDGDCPVMTVVAQCDAAWEALVTPDDPARLPDGSLPGIALINVGRLCRGANCDPTTTGGPPLGVGYYAYGRDAGGTPLINDPAAVRPYYLLIADMEQIWDTINHDYHQECETELGAAEPGWGALVGHELGHTLGLGHTTVDDNLMTSGVCSNVLSDDVADSISIGGTAYARDHFNQIEWLRQVSSAGVWPGAYNDPPAVHVPGALQTFDRFDRLGDVARADRRVDLSAATAFRRRDRNGFGFTFRLPVFGPINETRPFTYDYWALVDMDHNAATGGRGANLPAALPSTRFDGAELVVRLTLATAGSGATRSLTPSVWVADGAGFRPWWSEFIETSRTQDESVHVPGRPVFDYLSVELPVGDLPAALQPLVEGVMRLQAVSVSGDSGAVDRLDDGDVGRFVSLQPPRFPVCAVTPALAAPGDEVAVKITGLIANRGLHVILGASTIATGRTDGAGAAEVKFTIPANANAGKRLVTVGTDDTVLTADCSVNVRPQSTDPTLRVAPGSGKVQAGGLYTVALRVDNIKNLYGAQLELSFDETRLEVLDADPGAPGVQIHAGSFLPVEFEARNSASNSRGTIEYSVSRQGAVPGVSGSGVLAVIGLRAKATGTAPIRFTKVILSDPQSQPIKILARGGQVIVTQADPALLPFDLRGKVVLERRQSSAGARVCVGARCAVTAADGAYALAGVKLNDRLAVTHPSYLAASRLLTTTPASPGGTVQVPDVTLLGGDVDQDGRIQARDAILLARDGWNARAGDARYQANLDITDDRAIDLLDMVAVQFNFLRAAPGPWPSLLAWDDPTTSGSEPAFAVGDDAPAIGMWREGQARWARRPPAEPLDRVADRPPLSAGQTPARVWIDPAMANTSGLGLPVRLDVRVADVSRLFGYNLKLHVDPAVLTVQDQNPRQAGVQVLWGDFLDVENLLVVYNQADNASGTIDLMVTQTYPATGRSGAGVLASVIVAGLAKGSSDVTLEEVELFNDTPGNLTPLPVTRSPGKVTVGSDQFKAFVPWSARP